jgi:hypothetical protein
VECAEGFVAQVELSPRERVTVLAGGLLNQLREREERSE